MIKPRPEYRTHPIKKQYIDGFMTRPKHLVSHNKIPLTRPSANYLKPEFRKRPVSSTKQSVSPLSYQSQSSMLNTTISSNKPISSQFGDHIKPNKKTKKKPRSGKKIAFSVALVAVFAVLTVGGWVGWRALANINKVFHGNFFSDITAAFNNTPLKGEGTGRVNILLAGDSSDQPGHGGADLTDSILLLSINTQNHSAFLLSIPRDLWVDIPGYGWQKINAANDNMGTNFPGYPQNGMGQLQHLATTDLGIPIDYYALSDYGAFKDAVDAVGGVTVDIQSPDPRGLYDPNTNLNLPNGSVFLNGQEALNLARARGDGYGSYGFPSSDFDRTEHQRQIFTAIVKKAQTLGFISNPVKISDLFNAFGNNVETDLSLQNVLRLVQITKGINLSKIQSYAYCSTLTVGSDGCNNPILTDYTNPSSGEEALIPTAGISNYNQLQSYYDQLTSNNPVVQENANVVVLNGSNVDGLAKKESNLLTSKGFDVSTITDASTEYPNSMIVDLSNGKDPASKALLSQIFSSNTTAVTSVSGSAEAGEASNYPSADFVVILGENWDSPQGNT
ncbi:MAG TPA: LCP family protein [Candidatus Saccharimonadales bacterium]|nr:LCP family protein [Candidatus Saccharimonadales bacterium]